MTETAAPYAPGHSTTTYQRGARWIVDVYRNAVLMFSVDFATEPEARAYAATLRRDGLPVEWPAGTLVGALAGRALSPITQEAPMTTDRLDDQVKAGVTRIRKALSPVEAAAKLLARSRARREKAEAEEAAAREALRQAIDPQAGG